MVSYVKLTIRIGICLALVAICLLFNHCSNSSTTPDNTIPTLNKNFAKGADVSWITEMEAAGVKFYNTDGTQQDCMQILKDLGINSIRLRVWVSPANKWNNKKDVVVKAKRAQNLGMKIMIDFHYSDTWADPGHQPKPTAWAGLNFTDLKSAVFNHTKDVMDTLKINGITPDWVQIGNEIDDGMLWEDGRASTSMNKLAGLLINGYNAVKQVSPTTLVIIHVSNGYKNDLFRWIFDGLKNNGVQWDIIGLSLYPSYAPGGISSWSEVNIQCQNNMSDLVFRYNTSVMIVETGTPADQPVVARAFLTDLINKTNSIAGGKGLGVFYWEPECYNWAGYKLGAFDNTGKPTVALDAFKE